MTVDEKVAYLMKILFQMSVILLLLVMHLAEMTRN